MSDTDLTYAELVSANPVPADTAPHHMALSEDEVLDVIERWSRAAARDTSVSLEPLRWRRGWLAAAATFAAVLLVVGVIAAVALNGGSDVVETPSTTALPTTQAPTTTGTSTTAIPEVAPDVRAAIDDFVGVFNAGDPATIIAALAPDAEVWTSLIAGTFTSEDPLPLADFKPMIERWLRYLSVQESAIDLDSCRPLDGGRVNCSGTFTDELVEASPLPPASLSVTFIVDEEGTVELFFVRENEAAVIASYDYFDLWLRENYPGEESQLYDGTGRPSFLEDAIGLWELRVAEWIDSLET